MYKYENIYVKWGKFDKIERISQKFKNIHPKFFTYLRSTIKLLQKLLCFDILLLSDNDQALKLLTTTI